MSLSVNDPVQLNRNCSVQAKYFIDDSPNSIGKACYKLHKSSPTPTQDQFISNFCSNMNTFNP